MRMATTTPRTSSVCGTRAWASGCSAASSTTAAITREARGLPCAARGVKRTKIIIRNQIKNTKSRSVDGGRTWSSLRPIEEPETEIDCIVYGVEKKDDKVTKTS